MKKSDFNKYSIFKYIEIGSQMILKEEYVLTILLVSNDIKNIENIKTMLQGHAFNVVIHTNLNDAITYLDCHIVEIILLDDSSILEGSLTCNIYRKYSLAPILILTETDSEIKKKIYLESNHIDRYIDKPIEPRLLLAHLFALIRIKNKSYQREWKKVESVESEQTYYQFGDFELNATTCMVFTKDNTPVPLTAGEYKLLKVFVAHPNQLLSRDRLLNMTKKGYNTNDRSIDTLISRLRRKLNSSCQMRTIRNEGYIFHVKIEKKIALLNTKKQLPKVVDTTNVYSTILLISDHKLDGSNKILAALEKLPFNIETVVKPTEKDIAVFFKEVSISLILLDINGKYDEVTRLSGVLRGYTLPFVILLANPLDSDNKIMALETGIDYIFHKPINLKLLVAYINKLATKKNQLLSSGPVYEISRWKFISTTYNLITPTKIKIKLNAQLGALLFTLISRSDEHIFSREELIESLQQVLNSHNERHIDSLISKLRRIFAQYDPGNDLIRTIRNRGYYMNRTNTDRKLAFSLEEQLR